MPAISGRVHEKGGLFRPGKLDFDQPARAIGILVDQAGIVAQSFIDCRHLAVGRQIERTYRFDGFERAEFLAFRKGGPGLGQFDIGDVAQLVLGKIGNSDAEWGGR